MGRAYSLPHLEPIEAIQLEIQLLADTASSPVRQQPHVGNQASCFMSMILKCSTNLAILCSSCSWEFHHTEPLILEIWLTRLLSESSPCLTCLPSCPYTTTGPSPLRTAATHHQTSLVVWWCVVSFNVSISHLHSSHSFHPLLNSTLATALTLLSSLPVRT